MIDMQNKCFIVVGFSADYADYADYRTDRVRLPKRSTTQL